MSSTAVLGDLHIFLVEVMKLDVLWDLVGVVAGEGRHIIPATSPPLPLGGNIHI